ncbi:TrkH family potassium uptake protein [uncultured Anaerococcus sp.]|uniref:TrkH family potassium uptake protein n=1 Tax=uncultured Anaerococcus sp. TaxID=293428 RepID=UPI00288C3A60|nr:TrkH family potassium uptake protein [uncultured Anaerococcus sp.]
MNGSIIKYTIGKLLQVLAMLMCVPLLVGLIYREGFIDIRNFILPILLAGILGTLLARLGSNKGHIFTKEAMFITATCWLIFSVIGAIPLYLTASNYPSVVDAFFEMASGFTTCGASVAFDVELLPHSIIFWRSFSHFIGGMGILVFTLAILPKTNKESSTLMQAEVPGPTFGKITPKLSQTARVLYLMYVALTIVTVVFLLFGGMNLFDALIHAMGTAGTGGFSNKAVSVGYYDSRYIEIVLSIAMLAFGMNFNIFYFAIFRSVKDALKSEELWWYLGIVGLSAVLIYLNIRSMYPDEFYSGVESLFTVSSIITTTGFVSVDFGSWPLFSRHILILLMFIGGSAGSTAGGLKVSRVVVMFKSAINQIRKAINPLRVNVSKMDGKRVDDEVEESINRYLIVYALLFVVFMLVVTLDTNNFESAFSAVATTYNNVGPGLIDFGPITSFASMSKLSKLVLSFAMIFGRLELYPMILLFAPRTYKNVRK